MRATIGPPIVGRARGLMVRGGGPVAAAESLRAVRGGSGGHGLRAAREGRRRRGPVRVETLRSEAAGGAFIPNNGGGCGGIGSYKIQLFSYLWAPQQYENDHISFLEVVCITADFIMIDLGRFRTHRRTSKLKSGVHN